MKDFASEYTVLIVDDIPTNVMLVQAILKKEGYSLLTADGGAKALHIAETRHPNLILLDIMMPGMDGYEVLQHLKSNPDTNDIPVIIMSALSDMPSIVKGYQLGAAEYVTKPFQREELVKRVAYRFELYSIERIKQELEATIESRDMLYSLIARDLRTPLGSLKMLSNSILNLIDKEKIGDDAYGMFLMMNKTSEETFQLLDNLTKWNKYTQNKFQLYRQKTDINGLIEGIITLYRPIAELKQVTIRPEGLDTELMGMVDIDKIKTIVRNLLSNAVKNSHEGGTVVISTHTEGNLMHFSISDTGKSIKEEDLDNGNGSGLGLMICKAFVELHEGHFHFKSEEGKGTTFSFTLRIRSDEE